MVRDIVLTFICDMFGHHTCSVNEAWFVTLLSFFSAAQLIYFLKMCNYKYIKYTLLFFFSLITANLFFF